MVTVLLLLHVLVAVALLGAVTHQAAALFLRSRGASDRFLARYTQVSDARFTRAVLVLFPCVVLLGALIYPAYRVDVRIPFEEMGLRWAVGLFEVKEHAAGVVLGVLPLYAFSWRPSSTATHARDRRLLTALLTAVVWYDFVVGHLLTNIRGLA